VLFRSIIHFSPPNFSNKIRIVTNTYFTHQETKYRTYFFDKEKHQNQLEAFEQDDDFMTNFEQFGANIHDRPKVGKSMGLVDYNFPRINAAFLEQHYQKTNARELINSVLPKEKTNEVLLEQSLAETKSPEKKSFWKKIFG
jgi:hypothetical protein